MIIVTLSFTLIALNILITVLGETYSRDFSQKHRVFLQARANIVFEHFAVNHAYQRIAGCFGFSCRRRKTRDLSEEKRYVWFCRPKSGEELGLPDEDDDEQGAEW